MEIFRAVLRDGFVPGRVFEWREGTRLPGNVPYLVDNRWKYTRPADLPSRRNAIYASPSAALALEGAATPAVPAECVIACQVVLASPPILFQASVRDARGHPDLGTLQRLVNRYFHDPANAARDVSRLAPLFMPGTTRRQLQQAMKEARELEVLVDQLAGAVTLWHDQANEQEGEIIFTIEPGNNYRPVPVLNS